jgi:hypothetical protein
MPACLVEGSGFTSSGIIFNLFACFAGSTARICVGLFKLYSKEIKEYFLHLKVV